MRTHDTLAPTASWPEQLRRDASHGLHCLVHNEGGVWRNSQFLGAAIGTSMGSLGMWAGTYRSTGHMVWSILAGLGFFFGFFLMMGLAWLRPQWFAGRKAVTLSALTGFVAGAVGMINGLNQQAVHFSGDWNTVLDELASAVRLGMPSPLLMSLMFLVVALLTASQRREHLARELALARSRAEHAQAQQEASEARLRLLQAQIQPHFIFNTLAAVQHWVDEGDARASPLLRQLTTFLRGSAELMLRARVSLAEELKLVEAYLGVMQARWGERLHCQWHIDADVARHAQLPPGIVLSLVENALEHGIAPTLHGATLYIELSQLGAETWRLRIEDGGVGLHEGWHEGLGLSNCRARLEGAFGPSASLTLSPRPQGPGTCVELQLERPA